MKPEDIKFPKKYVDRTDETRNREIQELFKVKKKDETNSQEEEGNCN